MSFPDSNDILVGRSVGAAAWNYDILLPDGSFTRLVEGSKVTKVVQIAGPGTTKRVRIDAWLTRKYGTQKKGWTKMVGDGYVDFFGVSRRVQLHWYQSMCEGSPKRVEFKVKRYYN